MLWQLIDSLFSDKCSTSGYKPPRVRGPQWHSASGDWQDQPAAGGLSGPPHQVWYRYILGLSLAQVFEGSTCTIEPYIFIYKIIIITHSLCGCSLSSKLHQITQKPDQLKWESMTGTWSLASSRMTMGNPNVLCLQVIASQAIKPAKLEQHHIKNYPEFKDKTK